MNRKIYYPILGVFSVLSSFFLLSVCDRGHSHEANLPGKQIQVIDDIRYREGDSHAWKLDMALPVNDSANLMPAIVIIHGGGWRAGSKRAPVYRALLLDYALQGYVTMSVEYRLLEEAPFPACIEDVKCAVRWLKAHADEYNIDTTKIGVFGHSAGAHLALMLAMTSSVAEPEGDGPWKGHSSRITSVVPASTPTQVVPWASPDSSHWPVGNISANLPPVLIIHGTKDEIVPVGPVDEFVEKLRQAGAKDITYLRVEGGNHGVAYEFNLDITRPAMDAFFERTLKH
ncbi:MAG: alpha/beta hydrolase [Bacteroidales bacterium]|nr:alpha/beta hydrolase [Bacteroidales bacterium]